ncbi:MAG TPA: hypothetical protein VHD31_03485 [Candidatus Paceibacterota bacterium]|nr:hypothetical protein [Candidatus Paceibacterota bacterium]
METDPQQIEELKQLVRQSIALSEENNKLLHGMRRSAWVSRGIRVLWIVGILIVSFYSYLYVQPYLNQILDFYGNLQNLQDKANSIITSFSNATSTSGK